LIDVGIPPTPATGLAVKLYVPPFVPTDAVALVESEIAPQPMLTLALPPMVIDAAVVLLSPTTQ
jgi:hypothetical protein